MKKERRVVNAITRALRRDGFLVATEVANFYRSADIAAIDQNGQVWIIECKISNIGQAIVQSRTHRLSANRVYIGVPQRKMRPTTLEKVRQAGIGLIYVRSDGSIFTALEEPAGNTPSRFANANLRKRILETA